jgi:capsular exopolysaccharide synthesis family protein
MDFWRVVAILNKRKGHIALSVVVSCVLTWGATHLMGSRWQATVRLGSPQVLPGLPSGMASGEAENGEEAAAKQAKSQAAMYRAMIKSRDVIGPALARLHRPQLPQSLLDSIEVDVNRERVIELQVTDSTARHAESLANALADSFVEKYHSLYTRQAEKVVKLLESQLAQADASLAETRRRYDMYRAQYEITGNDVGSTGTAVAPGTAPASTIGQGSPLEAALTRLKTGRQRRDELIEQMAGVQAQLQQKENQLAHLSPTMTVSDLAASDPDVKQLEEELARAEKALSDLRERQTDGSPYVQSAMAERKQLDQRLKAARAKVKPTVRTQSNPAREALLLAIGPLREEVAGYKAQIAALDKTTRQVEAEVNKFKGTGNPLAVLASDLVGQSEARASLAQRVNNAHMALDGAARQDPMVILESVSAFNPPINATAGRTKKLVLLAGLCALILSSGLVFALDSVDRRLKTVGEAEHVLPARVLAVIPQPVETLPYATLARATELNPQSLQSEAYRFLGLHLLSAHFPQVRSLMVLSAKAEQGSTTTVANLGITLAQAGQRVILVDANIRTAEMHHVFGMPNEFGFTDLLQNPDATAFEQALHPTSVPNLSVITSGSMPYNPWELFRSPSVLEVSRRLHERADYVLYDTPSALIFTDALNLAPVVDAAFLCVRAQEPLTGAEQRLIELLEQANVPVLGSVLNDVPVSILEGYRNYRHYYAQSIPPGPVTGTPEDAAGAATRPPLPVEAADDTRNRPTA